MEFDFFVKILLSSILGWIIWLERDISHKNEQEQFAWLRTFALISIFWTFSVFLDTYLKTNQLYSIWIFVIISILVISSYIYSSFKQNSIWITSELCALLTFFVWMLVWMNFSKIAIIFAISIIIIISLKEKFGTFKAAISKEEFNHTLKFAVIAFVVLPLLPNMKFSIGNLLSFIWLDLSSFKNPILEMAFFNPYSVWFFVVVMSAVWYIWYVLSKLFWKKSSVLLSSLIWWLVSSTAVTATMSEQSKKDPKNPYIYVLWVLSANSVMLIRVLWIVTILNIALVKDIWIPACLMLLSFFGVMVFSYQKSKSNIDSAKISVEEKIESPFRIAPAIKFWLLILFIKFIAWIWLVYKDVFGWAYFYYVFWVISWFADVDAITQTMATQSKEWLLLSKIAVSTIILAVMSNNVVKASMSYKFWDKHFWKIVSVAFGISIVLWIAGIFAF